MKLSEVLPPHHKERFKHYKVENFLDFDVPVKTDKIVEGCWKLTEEEKWTAINILFQYNKDNIIKVLMSFKPTNNFHRLIQQSYTGKEPINYMTPSLSDIKNMYDNNFRILNSNETKSNKKVLKDNNNTPILDKRNNIQYIDKPEGEPVWNNTQGNITSFVSSYIQAFQHENLINPYSSYVFTTPYSRITNFYTGQEHFNYGNAYLREAFETMDMELYISSEPLDLLNQSMSPWYESCQLIYREARGFNDYKPLLANLFDYNTKIAYLRFNIPFTDYKGNVAPFSSFARMFIRLADDQIYFDYVYNNILERFMYSITEKYTGLKSTFIGGEYKYQTIDSYASHSYLDRLRPKWSLVGSEEIIKSFKNYFNANVKETNKDNIFTIEGKGYYLIIDSKTVKEKYKNIVYKRNVYGNYIDWEKLSKSGIIPNTVTNFNELIEWSESKTDKLKKTQLYRLVAPFLIDDFWKTRSIDAVIPKWASDKVVHKINDEYLAFKQ